MKPEQWFKKIHKTARGENSEKLSPDELEGVLQAERNTGEDELHDLPLKFETVEPWKDSSLPKKKERTNWLKEWEERQEKQEKQERKEDE